MAFIDLLVHRATVQRFTAGAVDAYGTPVKTWSDYLTDIPCRVAQQTASQLWNGAMLEKVDYRVFVLDIDVTELDRLVWEGQTHKILSVDHTSDSTTVDHHKELQVQILRPSSEPT